MSGWIIFLATTGAIFLIAVMAVLLRLGWLWLDERRAFKRYGPYSAHGVIGGKSVAFYECDTDTPEGMEKAKRLLGGM